MGGEVDVGRVYITIYPVYPFTLLIPSYLPKSILMAIYLSTLFTLLHSILPPTFNLYYHLPFYPVCFISLLAS